MKRHTVVSSDIASIAFREDEIDAPTGTLQIEFRKGWIYEYHDVPRTEFLALLEAESVGREFHARIKTKNYAYDRIA